MKTEWDYTDLAAAYLKRPDYSNDAIDELVRLSRLRKGGDVCDVGAGVAHLTLKLAERGFRVTAVEPNDAMRALGSKRTQSLPNVTWFEGTGENTGRTAKSFDLVTFGSSFNVVNRPQALREVSRILREKGWLACMWNHRDLSDPIQASIERVIGEEVEGYSYGVRREDQTEVIMASGFVDHVEKIEGSVEHVQSVEDCLEAWRSHATLERQAGSSFPKVIDRIAKVLADLGTSSITIPYVTRIWVAQFVRSA